jgi:two-component system chemotaxis response regulator CheY
MPAVKRIVLVDDNQVMRALLRAIVRSDEKLEVVAEAHNGVLGLEAAARHRPDVVCLDVMMPGMDGLTVLREIKSRYPEIRVVMITGTASTGNVQEAIAQGADGFIVKPFNAATVLKTLLAL